MAGAMEIYGPTMPKLSNEALGLVISSEGTSLETWLLEMAASPYLSFIGEAGGR